jgi:hypothetical protein
MIRQFSKRFILPYALNIALVFASALSLSAEGRIGHTPLRSNQLPEPGTAITLSFIPDALPGVIARERLLVIRDGKMLDVPLVEGPIEGKDQLAHNAIVHAPLAELSYQALITLADGTVVTSPRYTLKRNCLPNIALATLDDPQESSVKERLERYVIQARELERELTQYDIAIGLVESLLGQMKE